MATTLEELVVKIQGDVSDLKAKFEESSAVVKTHTESMASAIASFTDQSGKHFLDFHHVAETALGVFGGELLMKGLEAFKGALEGAFDLMKEGISSAIKEEDAMNRLGIAMGAAGQYSHEASEHMSEFAESLEHNSKFGKDAILNAAGLLETLGHLNEDGLKRATTASMNLAAAMGMDLNSASMLVGKAAEGNVMAFKRYGLEVQEGATKSQTFANALSAIEKLGDVASGQLNTFSGATAQVNRAFEDVTKTFGQTVVENQAVIDVFKECTKILDKTTEYVAANKQQIKLWIAEGMVLAVSVTQVFIDTLDEVWKIGKVAFEALAAPVKVLTASLVAAGMAIKGDFAGAFELMKDSGKEAIKDVVDASTGPTGFTAISKVLDALGMTAAKAYVEMEKGADKAAPPITNLKKHAAELSEEMRKAGEAGKGIADNLTKIDPSKDQKNEEKNLKLQLEAKQLTLDQYHKKELDSLKKKIAEEQKLMNIAHEQGKVTDYEYWSAIGAQAVEYDLELRDLQQRQKEEEETLQEQKISATSQTFGNLSSLMKTSNKEMFEIGKAAATAQAVVDGYAAVAKALSAAPPPFNFALAASVGIASAVQIANIQASHLATGIDSVPGIGAMDSFPAVLAPGERVVPAQTNQDLTSFLRGNQGGQSEMASYLGAKLDQVVSLLAGGQTIQIDGREVFAVVRNQLRSGRAFA